MKKFLSWTTVLLIAATAIRFYDDEPDNDYEAVAFMAIRGFHNAYKQSRAERKEK